MTSAPSDSESNVSSFIRYNDKDLTHLYTSMLKNMVFIAQDIFEIERNMKILMKKAGPLETHLITLMQSFPKSNINIPMQTE